MKGTELEHIRFQHPLYARASLGVLADYVTIEQGTGAVHTAPGHGSDDFKTGVKYGLEIYAPVGPGGHFLQNVELFGGKRVFDANPEVEEALKVRGRLWHREPFQAKYGEGSPESTATMIDAERSATTLRLVPAVP